MSEMIADSSADELVAHLMSQYLAPPSRLAPLLAAESDPASVQTMLHAEIHNALHQLSGAIDQVGQTNGVIE